MDNIIMSPFFEICINYKCEPNKNTDIYILSYV